MTARHLTDDEWEQFACHELSPRERQAAGAHIAACGECGAIARELTALEDGARAFDPGVPSAAVPQERSRGWRWDLAAAFAAGAVLVAAAILLPLRQIIPMSPAPAPVAVPTDSLALAKARYLEQRVRTLETQLETAMAPHANAAVVDLIPDATRGAASNAVVPEDAEVFTLVLNTLDERVFDEYSVDVQAGGTLLRTVRGLRPTPVKNFTLSFSRKLMPPGDYRIRLNGTRGSRTERLAEYTVRVR